MMNLLHASWLPFRCRNGEQVWRPITAIVEPDIMDFALPRADFQGAAYQFSIGILQTIFAPENKKEWLRYFEQAPTKETLVLALKAIEHAFELNGDGPLFMQDRDPLVSQKTSPVSGLLIDAPGENGLKNNTDFFIKRGVGEVMSPAMAALALFTLQINAPSGGVGHRVGLRGGGPLTTLIVPANETSSLWQKLWLNVINRQYWDYDAPNFHDGSVFPWLGATRESSKKGDDIYPTSEGIHPLHMYWAMPRRIRLVIDKEAATCSISGEPSERSVRGYRTKNYGNNYVGNWDPHPFTPYTWNPKKPAEDHLSQKGQPGGITYKTWDILTLTDQSKSGHVCARVVDHYNAIARRQLPENPQVWVFGYDMDNMKPRGWYCTKLPFLTVNDEHRDGLLTEVRRLQELSNGALYQTRSQIKAAWFEKPGDVKGDTSFIDLSFWQWTQGVFYETVSQLATNLNQEKAPLTPEQALYFRRTLQGACELLFDSYALDDDLGEVRSMAKKMEARRYLMGWLFGGKPIKEFNHNYQLEDIKEKSNA
ncbi:type I-E CRISPR-associated protein Cse1/CasA [Vibrio harveyi]|nr:type I-E CRISPR-associated protein Cse1/CasA [Vibrio harveyi]